MIKGSQSTYILLIVLVAAVAIFALYSVFSVKDSTLMADTAAWPFDTGSNYTYDSSKIEVTGGYGQLKITSGLDSSTQGLWHLDESSGDLYDSTSNGNDLTSNGDPTYNVAGKFNTALGFDGSNDLLFISDNEQTGLDITGSITVEAWIYQSSSQSDYRIIAGKWKKPGNKMGYALAVRDKAAFYWSEDGSDSNKLESINAVPTDQWVHIAGVYDGSNSYVFINGSLENSVSYSNGIADNNVAFQIGGGKLESPNIGYYQGKIDEVRVSNTARWTSDFTPPSNPYGSYPIDKPTIRPNTSNAQSYTSLSGFSATEVLDGGSIRYQITGDGTSASPTWYWWDGSTWLAASDSSQSNEAIEVNDNISQFVSDVGTGDFSFRAFLISNGSQLVKLDNVQLTYAVNTAPSITIDNVAQTTDGTKYVTIYYTGIDAEGDSSSLVAYEYSTDDSNWFTMTEKPGVGSDGTSGLTFSPGGTSHDFMWDVGADLADTEDDTVYVRLKANDGTTDGNLATSSAFAVDTKEPAGLTSDLVVQPNAGDTAVTINCSFAETNPDTNTFYVAIGGGAYSSGTAGDTDTASPSDQATDVGATLDGDDYVSKVKCVHVDDFGNEGTSENTSPSTSYKYVKPYTPSPPTINNPTTNSVDVTVNKNASEATGLEYAIYENTKGKYVQADGALGATAVWQTIATWGTKTVTGLSSPVTGYIFQTKSRNSADTDYAASSESEFSGGASAAVDTEVSPPPPSGGGVVFIPGLYDPPTPPPGGFRLAINPLMDQPKEIADVAGAGVTNSPEVKLLLVAGADTTDYALANEGDFSRAVIKPFEPERILGASPHTSQRKVWGQVPHHLSEKGVGASVARFAGQIPFFPWLLIIILIGAALLLFAPELPGWVRGLVVVIVLASILFSFLGIPEVRDSLENLLPAPTTLQRKVWGPAPTPSGAGSAAVGDLSLGKIHIMAVPWILQKGFGEKTVCARFYTKYGVASDAVCDSILYERPPELEEVPPEEVLPPEMPPEEMLKELPELLPPKRMFTIDRQRGNYGFDILDLQRFLNENGFLLAESGPGSPGNETTFFGPLTQAALIKFQEAYREEILAPWGLVRGTGYFGPTTRALLNHQLKGGRFSL